MGVVKAIFRPFDRFYGYIAVLQITALVFYRVERKIRRICTPSRQTHFFAILNEYDNFSGVPENQCNVICYFDNAESHHICLVDSRITK